jgi:O-antigen/teichoic acid export membrane protein
MKTKETEETVRAILTVVTFIAFLGLIIFAIVYNTIKNQIMDKWYWGAIGALIVGIGVSVRWYFGGRK